MNRHSPSLATAIIPDEVKVEVWLDSSWTWSRSCWIKSRALTMSWCKFFNSAIDRSGRRVTRSSRMCSCFASSCRAIGSRMSPLLATYLPSVCASYMINTPLRRSANRVRIGRRLIGSTSCTRIRWIVLAAASWVSDDFIV